MSVNTATATQYFLEEKLKVLFPNLYIHVNVRKEHNFKYAETGSLLELDCWIPELNLGFEFQDDYHYVPTWYSHRSQNNITQRDSTKRSVVIKNNITLITIPCWWDGDHESLGATINFEIPSVLPSNVTYNPIPLNPPTDYFDDGSIPNVGALMLASFMENGLKDITNWWIGEKYDGVRLCWVANKQQMFSRRGVPVNLPQSVKQSLPKSYLDGEFWFGRGQFQVACMVVNFPEIVLWQTLRVVVFDNPARIVHKQAFEDRYMGLFSSVPPEHPFVIIAPRILLKHKRQLNTFAREIIAHEGEGLMLREPGSLYHSGRSASLFKLKSAQFDKEAMVVGFVNKAIKLGLTNGTTFLVPEENVKIPIRPKIGQVVTFSYERRTTTDTPLNPAIVKIRDDLLWHHVDRSKLHVKFLADFDNSENSRVPLIATHLTQRMRGYLENYAKIQNLDPLLPATWYEIAGPAILQFQSGKLVLQKFGGSFYRTMKYLFPELRFNRRSFPEVQQRRAFFESYAWSCQFDFRDPANWYLQSFKKIKSFEGALNVLSFHGGSIPRALMELFPDITFDHSKFLKNPSWRNIRNRRVFFEQYAKENNFDPLVPENWYTKLQKKKVYSKKGASMILAYYNNSIPNALSNLFPDIGLDASKLQGKWLNKSDTAKFFTKYAKLHKFDPRVPNNWYLHYPSLVKRKKSLEVVFHQNRSVLQTLLLLYPSLDRSKFSTFQQTYQKQLFENFAHNNGFDPYVPKNWYLQSHKLISDTKGIKQILSFYNNSIAQALLRLFPNIGLERRFLLAPRDYWKDTEKCREFFVSFAKQNGFDPFNPENWYSIRYTNISTSREGKFVLGAYGSGSIIKALVSSFPSISFDESKFTIFPKNYWHDPAKQQQFFISFAQKKGFDYLVADNWYSITNASILSYKGARNILQLYENNIAKALMYLFPNIGLQQNKFL